ncbi:globin family protein [Mycobacterium kansasii]|uniref:Globin family protein n=1 Tax=Mycobacterium kansasii TaxID=1768 RepID=A0A1V3WTE5_MYCKA|nr:globin family protein [Mycobacterium kansasii]
MGLEDRDALRVLRDAFAPAEGRNDLVRRFYTNWFALDASVRDLFPPEMDSQRAAFAHALHWVYGELVEQRAEEPVAFLAQLGRDHRKYGVLPTQYDTLRRALYQTLRGYLGQESRRAWTDTVERAADQSLKLITGVMSGAADAEQGPAWWNGTVVEHARVSRDLAVVRLRLDQPLDYHPGQYVNVHVPQCPAAGDTSAPPSPPTPTAGSSFTSAWCPAAW